MPSNNGNGQCKMLDLRVTKLSCDPVQYKPYSPEFEPGCELIFRVPVPSEYVEDCDESVVMEDGNDLVTGVMVVGQAGFQFIAKFISDTIEQMDQQRKDEKNATRKVRRVGGSPFPPNSIED